MDQSDEKGMQFISRFCKDGSTVTHASRSQALKIFQQRQLRSTIATAKRLQEAVDTQTILAKREDKQISKAMAELVKSSTLPLLVDDPSDAASSLNTASVSRRGTRRVIEATMHETADYALYKADTLKPNFEIRPTSTSAHTTSAHTNTRASTATKVEATTKLVSNNSLPSLVSQSNAIFPKMEHGDEELPEGSGHVSMLYKSLVGIERTKGPQTASDHVYHADQAEKGIRTKYNTHLFPKEGKVRDHGLKHINGATDSRRSSATNADISKGSSAVGAPGAGLPGRSNDIFSGMNNGSRKNKEKREAAALEMREKNKNADLLKAFTLCHDARTLLDPTRLLFDAAVLYDNIGIRDKAISTYEKASIRSDSEGVALIVDSYDLTEDVGFHRRVERMSEMHRKQYLEKRAQLRHELIFAEEERQRLRSIVSKGQLVRLYLLEDDFPKAHASMVNAFNLTKSVSEHSELLYFFHETLKEYSNKCFGELSKAQQLMRGSAGPLAEAHLHILHELLEEDGRNADVLEWLGKRYAEKLDLHTAYAYYKRATDLRTPVQSSVDARDMWITRGGGGGHDDNDAELLRNISKSKRIEFRNDELQIDLAYRDPEYIASGLRDYAWPEQKHQGSHIILYEKPAQGWAYGIRMQQERQRRLGIEFRLPSTSKLASGETAAMMEDAEIEGVY